MSRATTPTDTLAPYRVTLNAYRRALRREAHVLAEQPELAFQQLHNRLQWEGEAVEEGLAAERERRSAPGAIVAAARGRSLPLAWIHAGNRTPGTLEPTSLGEAQGEVTYEHLLPSQQ